MVVSLGFKFQGWKLGLGVFFAPLSFFVKMVGCLYMIGVGMMEEASSNVFLLLSILKLGAMVVRSCVDGGCVVSNGGR